MTSLTGHLSRIIDGVLSTFGRDRNRPVIVTLVPMSDTDRAGGIYIRGQGLPEASARFISWRNAINWAQKPDGKVARRWLRVEREENPDYAMCFDKLARAVRFCHPEEADRIFTVLGLRPPIEKFGENLPTEAEVAAVAEEPIPDEYIPVWTRIEEGS